MLCTYLHCVHLHLFRELHRLPGDVTPTACFVFTIGSSTSLGTPALNGSRCRWAIEIVYHCGSALA
jgi:hypothetical protein